MSIPIQAIEQSSKKVVTRQKNPLGNFARKTVLTSALALASVSVINAQVKQVRVAGDSIRPSVKFIRSWYSEEKNNHNMKASTIEFIGSFEVYISKNPNTELKISDNIILSTDEQKSLRKEEPLFVENDKYVLYYAPPDYLGDILIFKGVLSVFKKKTPPKQDEITPKLIHIFV